MTPLQKIISVLLIFFSSLSAGNTQVTSDRMCALIQAARDGDPAAQCELGLAYYYGRGVLKDPVEAKCWIKRAHENGSEQARTIYNDLQLWTFPGTCETLSGGLMMAPKYQSGDRFIDPETGMVFIWLPGGCFDMGCLPLSGKCDKDTVPSHKVCLKGFWIGQSEVTQDQWKDVMQTNPSHFNAGGDYPVETVSFNEVQQFIETLNQTHSNTFDLPSEAQWEYACRGAGENVLHPFKDNGFRPRANCGTCDSDPYRGRTSPVMHFPPGRHGLYGMGGNVREWCRDVYDQKAYTRHPAKESARGVNTPDRNASRVVRGGSWTDTAGHSGCISRNKSLPGIKSHNTGFRLIMVETP